MSRILLSIEHFSQPTSTRVVINVADIDRADSLLRDRPGRAREPRGTARI